MILGQLCLWRGERIFSGEADLKEGNKKAVRHGRTDPRSCVKELQVDKALNHEKKGTGDWQILSFSFPTPSFPTGRIWVFRPDLYQECVCILDEAHMTVEQPDTLWAEERLRWAGGLYWNAGPFWSQGPHLQPWHPVKNHRNTELGEDIRCIKVIVHWIGWKAGKLI